MITKKLMGLMLVAFATQSLRADQVITPAPVDYTNQIFAPVSDTPDFLNQKLFTDAKIGLFKKMISNLHYTKLAEKYKTKLGISASAVALWMGFILLLNRSDISEIYYETGAGSNRVSQSDHKKEISRPKGLSGAIGECLSETIFSKEALLADTIIFTVAYLIANACVNNSVQKEASFKALKNYIVNWESYKKLTPEEFHPFFEEISKAYQSGVLNDEQLEKLTPKALAIIQKYSQDQSSVLTFVNIVKWPAAILAVSLLAILCAKYMVEIVTPALPIVQAVIKECRKPVEQKVFTSRSSHSRQAKQHNEE